MHFLIDIFRESISITLFVIVMMMIIEYVNVKSKGVWTAVLKNSTWLQIILCAFLGLIPGCLGGFIVVSLYTHKLIRIGALLTALIATFGDEAYIFLSMSPGNAINLGLILFAIAIFIGFITDLIFKDKHIIKDSDPNFIIHQEELSCSQHDKKLFNTNLKQINFTRALLIFGLAVYFIALISGILGEEHHNHGHDHSLGGHQHELFGEWLKYTYLVITSIALVISFTVSDHFLEEHIWGHVLKQHFLKIFLWILGTLFAIHLFLDVFYLESWVSDNLLTILILALLIGIIPTSGPNLLFITLFLNNSIPFSILLANSIVQDGHASLPLFAESKKSFILMKGIKLLLGLVIGLAGYFMNW